MTLFSEKSEHVSIFDQGSRTLKVWSTAAILEMPYVAYPKNVAYALLTLDLLTKFHTLINTHNNANFLCLAALVSD